MSTRMENFITQQVIAMGNQQAIQVDSSAKQERMFKMLEALQSRSIEGEPNDKTRKVVES